MRGKCGQEGQAHLVCQRAVDEFLVDKSHPDQSLARLDAAAFGDFHGLPERLAPTP
jgi:hypothetical protein